ncbi:MAG: hypothetical protein PSV46_08250 [Reyranella sp.]|nr:hypothetical protein [Reyranella sp.]
MNGTEKPVWRNGRKVGSVRQFDNRLLQFLLRAHRPEVYGDKKQSTLPPLSFDLAQRLASSAPRLEAHRAERAAWEAAERRAEEAKKPGQEKQPRRERKNANG